MGTAIAALNVNFALCLWLQVELKADEVQLIGSCDAEKYPLQKKRHTLEFLRGIAHLRPRTNTVLPTTSPSLLSL